MSEEAVNEEARSHRAALTEQDRADLATGQELRLAAEGELIGAAHLGCLILIRQAVSLAARRSEYTETNVRMDGQPVGTWKITVEEVEDERSAV